MSKYKKCFDCDFFENRCYTCGTVIPLCNKYHCCTDPEYTCRKHKKHNHRNYEPELYASLPPGVKTTGADSPPFVPDVMQAPVTKTERGTHFVRPSKSESSLSLSPSKE